MEEIIGSSEMVHIRLRGVPFLWIFYDPLVDFLVDFKQQISTFYGSQFPPLN